MSELASESVESKDKLYFLESVTFSVENCLFRVPKYHFSNGSKFFAEEYLATGGSEDSEEPIALADVTKTDFQNFLKTLYPLRISATLSLTRAEWISVLKLSTLWKFGEVRMLAISQLNDMNSLGAAECVQLGKYYVVAAWVVSGLERLIKQPETIHSADTADKIGGDTAVRLCRLREDYRQSRLVVPLSSALGEVFSEELRALGMGDDAIKDIGVLLQSDDCKPNISKWGGKKKQRKK